MVYKRPDGERDLSVNVNIEHMQSHHLIGVDRGRFDIEVLKGKLTLNLRRFVDELGIEETRGCVRGPSLSPIIGVVVAAVAALYEIII